MRRERKKKTKNNRGHHAVGCPAWPPASPPAYVIDQKGHGLVVLGAVKGVCVAVLHRLQKVAGQAASFVGRKPRVAATRAGHTRARVSVLYRVDAWVKRDSGGATHAATQSL